MACEAWAASVIPLSLQEPSTNWSSEATGLGGMGAVQRLASTEWVWGRGGRCWFGRARQAQMVRDLAARPKSLDLGDGKGSLQEASAGGWPITGIEREKISHNAREGVAFGRGLDRRQAVKGTYLGRCPGLPPSLALVVSREAPRPLPWPWPHGKGSWELHAPGGASRRAAAMLLSPQGEETVWGSEPGWTDSGFSFR